MKKLIIATLLTCSIGVATSTTAQVHINVNIGKPVAGEAWYNNDDNYYYLPEQGVYYNVNRHVYVYQDNNDWVYGPSLPARYNGYTWQRSHYVVVRERTPFSHHDNYVTRYPHDYKGGHGGRGNSRNHSDRNHSNRR